MVNKQNIYVLYGKNPKQMAYEIFEQAHMEEMLSPGMKIALKPNLVVAKTADSGATTHPELAAGIIEFLFAHDVQPQQITIMEGSWLGDDTRRAFSVSGFESVAKQYGVALLDLKRAPTTKKTIRGESVDICTPALEADLLINMPVLKAHCQTALTCALKNLKGCIPDREKRRFHADGLHGPIAALSALLPVSVTLVDGICGDLTFEEGGTPVQMDRVLLGWDPVKIDAYAAELIGLSIDEVPYIKMAERLGVGSTSIAPEDIIALNEAIPGKFAVSRRAEALGKYIVAENACSACYGSLIHALQRMDENGALRRFRGSIHIGQGFRGKQIDGIGVGACCSGCTKNVKGCPATAADILKMLQE